MALESESLFGCFPIDYIIESVIQDGIAWFRENPETAADEVFGQLKASILPRYGQEKIDEIKKFINETDIPIVQHWSLVPTQLPCFSIQLLDGREDESTSGLENFMENVDTIGGEIITDRKEISYAGMRDNVQIGIHANITPDLTKYLYYFLVAIFVGSQDFFQDRGVQLHTWSATDISRINEYLPEGIYSRFINFSCFTTPRFIARTAPIITTIDQTITSLDESGQP